jgi:DNA-directed RNA polymerase subunit F
MNLKRLPVLLLMSLIAFAVQTGCKSGGEKKEADEDDFEIRDNNIIVVQGELFSIPSPLQTSVLLKESGAKYSKELLNPSSNLSSYSTNFKKAVNLGIYGADLGYVVIYNQTQDALGYMNASKRLSDDLNVSGAFNETLMKRFEKNMSNTDSLLAIFSSAYRLTDEFLKNNDRSEVSGLIIAGGWLESMYFTTHILQNDFNNRQNVLQRVAEQRNTLDHVIRLLTPYYNTEGKEDYTELIDLLIELHHEFEDIEIKYTYVKPTHDEANKITTINSTTEVNITEEQLKTITEKVAEIRNELIK